GGVRAMTPTPTVRAVMVGLMRGAAVGLMVGTREPTLRLGVRMMLCACTTAAPEAISGSSAADRIDATRRAVVRQFTPTPIIEPPFARATRRAALLRGHRHADDLLTLQPAQQACSFVLANSRVAELKLEHAALGAVDDRCMIIVEQRGDVGDTR